MVCHISSSEPVEVKRYLSRISYGGPTLPSVQTLSQLHRAHLFHVPFENLDIHLGNRIILNVDSLYDKIVCRRRGGFCYELNGLFAWLLAELGFHVTILSARVFDGGRPGPEFDHLTLLVELKEHWLADVGFGDSFHQPLRISEPKTQKQGSNSFRLAHEAQSITLYRLQGNLDWEPQYVFSLIPRQLSEFADMCQYHQTSPKSSFTRKRICTLPTDTGRVTLSNMRLIITEGEQRREEEVIGLNQYSQLLRQHFGINLEEAVVPSNPAGYREYKK